MIGNNLSVGANLLMHTKRVILKKIHEEATCKQGNLWLIIINQFIFFDYWSSYLMHHYITSTNSFMLGNSNRHSNIQENRKETT